jgi:hypothetical protein
MGNLKKLLENSSKIQNRSHIQNTNILLKPLKKLKKN